MEVANDPKVIPNETTKPGWTFASEHSNKNKFWGSLVLCGSITIVFAVLQMSLSASGVLVSVYLPRALLYSIGFVSVVGYTASSLHTYNYVWTLVSLVVMVGIGILGGVVVSCIFVQYTEYIRRGGLENLLKYVDPATVAFFMAGFPEELYKLIVYSFALGISKKNRTVFDALFLSAVSGASFGVFENLIPTYLLLSYRGIIFRMFWTTSLHTSLAMIGCMLLVYMKCGILNDRWYWYPFIYLVPATLHGTYDVFAFSDSMSLLIWPAGIFIIAAPLVLMIGLRRKQRSVSLQASTMVVHVV